MTLDFKYYILQIFILYLEVLDFWKYVIIVAVVVLRKFLIFQVYGTASRQV